MSGLPATAGRSGRPMPARLRRQSAALRGLHQADARPDLHVLATGRAARGRQHRLHALWRRPGAVPEEPRLARQVVRVPLSRVQRRGLLRPVRAGRLRGGHLPRRERQPSFRPQFPGPARRRIRLLQRRPNLSRPALLRCGAHRGPSGRQQRHHHPAATTDQNQEPAWPGIVAACLAGRTRAACRDEYLLGPADRVRT